MTDEATQLLLARRPLLALVADDDPGCRYLVAAVLQKIGLATKLAPDGAVAVQLAHEHTAELCCAILDVRMPVLDGMGTAEAIRRLAPGLTIIMMSAAFPSDYRERLTPLGITKLLVKPFPLDELRRLVLPSLGGPLAVAGPGVVKPAADQA